MPGAISLASDADSVFHLAVGERFRIRVVLDAVIPVGTPSLAIQPDLSVHNLITRIAVQGYFCFSSGHFPVLNLRSCRTFKVDVQVVYSHPVAMFQAMVVIFP